MTTGQDQGLRNSALLCLHGLRNLAYYRAGWHGNKPLFHGELMATMNGNCLDICVLEWCKLFALVRDLHYWANVVDDPTTYQTEFVQNVEVDAAGFEAYQKKMRELRDKFIAHLDARPTMHVPWLDTAKTSFVFHLHHLGRMDVNSGVLEGLPLRAGAYSMSCKRQAEEFYERMNPLTAAVARSA